MAHSVELILAPDAEEELTAQWRRLAAAGLPTALRRNLAPDDTHRPHLTLFAAHTMPDGADARLAEQFAGVVLDLSLRVGPLTIFGPRRGHCILVRAVVVSAALLDLQQRVLAAIGADPTGQFGDGRWSPHLTLARRIDVAQLSDAVAVLGPERTIDTHGVRIRRWDGDRRVAWWLTG